MTSIFLGILAKTSQIPLFNQDFENRKQHLRQEVRVNKHGVPVRRWVLKDTGKPVKKRTKKPQAPAKKRTKKPAPEGVTGLGPLYDWGASQASAKKEKEKDEVMPRLLELPETKEKEKDEVMTPLLDLPEAPAKKKKSKAPPREEKPRRPRGGGGNMSLPFASGPLFEHEEEEAKEAEPVKEEPTEETPDVHPEPSETLEEEQAEEQKEVDEASEVTPEEPEQEPEQAEDAVEPTDARDEDDNTPLTVTVSIEDKYGTREFYEAKDYAKHHLGGTYDPVRQVWRVTVPKNELDNLKKEGLTLEDESYSHRIKKRSYYGSGYDDEVEELYNEALDYYNEIRGNYKVKEREKKAAHSFLDAILSIGECGRRLRNADTEGQVKKLTNEARKEFREYLALRKYVNSEAGTSETYDSSLENKVMGLLVKMRSESLQKVQEKDSKEEVETPKEVKTPKETKAPKEPKEAKAPEAPKVEAKEPEKPKQVKAKEPKEVKEANGIDYTKGDFKEVAATLPKFGFEMLNKSTPTQRKAANKAARELLETLPSKKQELTPEQRKVLASYTGNGGLDGDLNAHYTPTVLAGAMWQLLHNAGFSGGKVLEPSCGAGVFMETAPQGAQMRGVELNEESHSVAKHLHPNATLGTPQLFEQFHAEHEPRKFDAVISNPPYGSRYQAAEDLDKPEIKQAEQYFIDTSLDHLKDGGLGVFLTNASPFESESTRGFRARLLARAEVLGCYQLPSSTFGDSNSGVAPTVLLLRKRPHDVGTALARMLEIKGEKILEQAGIADKAFLDGEVHLSDENVIGELGEKGYRGYRDVAGDIDAKSLSKMTDAKPREGQDLTSDDLDEIFDDSLLAMGRAYAADYGRPKEGEIRGHLIFHNHRWHRIDDYSPELGKARGLGEDLRNLANLRNNGTHEAAEAKRKEVEKRLQGFLSEHGNPHEVKAVLESVKQDPLLSGLMASISKDGKLAQFITEPIAKEGLNTEGLNKDSLTEVARFLHKKGKLDAKTLSKFWSGAGTEEEAETALLADPDIALTEDGNFVVGSDYYHGNTEERAASLDASAAAQSNLAYAQKYRDQANRFRAMQNKKTLEDIDVTPHDRWIPTEVLQDFAKETIDEGIRITEKDGTYKIEGSHSAGAKELEQYLNYRLRPDSVRKKGEKTALDIAAERAANLENARDRVKAIDNSFANWLSGSDHRETIENKYNDLFNSHVNESFDKSPLTIEESTAWTGPKLHDFQREAVRFSIQQGSSVVALDVGLGKTLTGIGLVGELKAQGKAKKPMIVVPKSLLGNWRENITGSMADVSIVSDANDHTAMGKRVLVIGQTYVTDKKGKGRWRDDTGADVATKLSRLGNDEWYAVLITRDRFSTIPLKPETWTRMTEGDAEKRRSHALSKNPDKAEKDAREREVKYANDIAKRAAKTFKTAEGLINWDDLGIDAVITDEAHAYKNLHSAPTDETGQSIAFMGAGSESKRAQDFNYKMRQVRERNGGHGVFMLTATPTKNSPLEVYNMLMHITDGLARRGIQLTDDFVKRYCDIEVTALSTINGDIKTAPAVVGFKNLHELRGLMGQYIFRRTAKSPDVVSLPDWHVPERQDIEQTFKMSDEVAGKYKELAEGAMRALRDPENCSKGRHAFSYLSDMRKLTLDPALLGYENTENPRFAKAAELTKRALEGDGKVVMFMDIGKQRGSAEEDERTDDEIEFAAEALGIPNIANKKPAELRKQVRERENADESNAYERLTQSLVQQGVPKEQIAIVTGDTAKTAQIRQDISKRYNDGEIKVVIGSTGIIGEGFNLQKGTSDMIHLDSPWDPGTYWQRLGRGERQGNELKHIRNHVLMADGSFDAVVHASMSGKRGWQQHLWEGTNDREKNDDMGMSGAEVQAMLSNDPNKQRELMQEQKEKLEGRTEAIALKKHYDDIHKASKLVNTSLRVSQTEATFMRTYQRSLDSAITAMRANGKSEEEVKAFERTMVRKKEGYEIARKKKADRAKDAVKKLLESDKLSDEHRALLESGQPFVTDGSGGFYAKDSTFEDGEGGKYKVDRIDSLNGKVDYRYWSESGTFSIKGGVLASNMRGFKNHSVKKTSGQLAEEKRDKAINNPTEYKKELKEHLQKWVEREGELGTLYKILREPTRLSMSELKDFKENLASSGYHSKDLDRVYGEEGAESIVDRIRSIVLGKPDKNFSERVNAAKDILLSTKWGKEKPKERRRILSLMARHIQIHGFLDKESLDKEKRFTSLGGKSGIDETLGSDSADILKMLTGLIWKQD